MKFTIVAIVVLLLPFSLKSQTDTTAKSHYIPFFQLVQQPSLSGGSVTIHQDSEVKKLFDYVELQNAKTKGLPGYRIRVFRENSQQARQKSVDLVGEVIAKYPDLPCYRYYDNPYFKVSVGDFRTRFDAMKVYKQVVKDFPEAFIVQETINFPRVD
ncbi:MAG TPA: hypothetical protein VMV56_01310 [Williamwhitmania sp.]|nr:hypothetical protein [Williamwhitmania sp.]